MAAYYITYTIIFITISLFYIVPILAILFLAQIFCKYKNRSYSKRLIYLIIIVVMLIRVISVLATLIIIYKNPPPSNAAELYKKMGVLKWVVAPDVNIIETHLYKRRNEMYKKLENIINNFDVDLSEKNIPNLPVDIYDGYCIKRREDKHNIYLYSIGPDKIDDNAEIIYDPTNGLKSIGDLIVKRNK